MEMPRCCIFFSFDEVMFRMRTSSEDERCGMIDFSIGLMTFEIFVTIFDGCDGEDGEKREDD